MIRSALLGIAFAGVLSTSASAEIAVTNSSDVKGSTVEEILVELRKQTAILQSISIECKEREARDIVFPGIVGP